MKHIDPPAEIRPAVDIAKLSHLWELASGREDRAEKTLAETRLEKGRLLVEARKAFPKTGNDGAWSKHLAKWKVEPATAWRYMKLAGAVESTSCSVQEAAPVIPSYASAGIVKPRRQEEPSGVKEDLDDGPTDEERESIYRDVVEASQPARMEVRETKSELVIKTLSDVRVLFNILDEKQSDLVDVTTSPDDFMRAKQLYIDITNRCLAALDRAGVLDGKEKRRQLLLLDGGKK